MDPAHYAGLLRPATALAAEAPPRWDPAYHQLGAVMVRDLAVYATVAELGGAP